MEATPKLSNEKLVELFQLLDDARPFMRSSDALVEREREVWRHLIAFMDQENGRGFMSEREYKNRVDQLKEWGFL